MEIDKEKGKEMQRMVLLKEVGVGGVTFMRKTREVFEYFDIDGRSDFMLRLLALLVQKYKY